jgi:hypothetical protein
MSEVRILVLWGDEWRTHQSTHHHHHRPSFLIVASSSHFCLTRLDALNTR